MMDNKVRTMKFTFFSREGKTFEYDVPEFQTVVEINDCEGSAKRLGSVARRMFDKACLAEAKKLSEGRDPQLILQIMWDKTKTEFRDKCINEATDLVSVEVRKFIKYTDKGHSVFIEQGTVFVDPALLPKSTSKPEGDYLFKSGDYSTGKRKLETKLESKSYGTSKVGSDVRKNLSVKPDEVVMAERDARKPLIQALEEQLEKEWLDRMYKSPPV